MSPLKSSSVAGICKLAVVTQELIFMWYYWLDITCTNSYFFENSVFDWNYATTFQ